MKRWVDGNQHDFVGAEGLAELGGLVEPLTEADAFALRLRAVRAGQMVLTYVAVTECRFTGMAVFPSRKDCVHLMLPFDTQFQVEERSVPAGGMVAMRETAPVALRLDAPGRALVVSMTKGVGPAEVAFSVDTPYLLRGASTSMAAVRAVAEVVFRSPGRDAGVAELLLGLSTAVLVEASITASISVDREERLAVEALKVISSEFRSRELTAKQLAGRVGVSVRALQRAFTARGGLGHVIRSYRTQEAIRLLGLRDMEDATFEMIARMSGFLDARAMRKAVIGATGMLPAHHRRN
ncbi:helix-turn-helix domain-containing protein [Sinomonas terrae]|uniref:Helix-turn-helix domain-containing protein n=1 Tax=Sinomonas terrae TaxID=2908838 RepID=A0ABS9TX43_9MICC|nr:helix-turn-helix domain-containing protein [Sinomonas terrae]MCH6468993.1 helix-turn-helix domain-containing protein [Sinomonas terrae]